MFLSSSISCGTHETLPQSIQFTSWSADQLGACGTSFPQLFCCQVNDSNPLRRGAVYTHPMQHNTRAKAEGGRNDLLFQYTSYWEVHLILQTAAWWFHAIDTRKTLTEFHLKSRAAKLFPLKVPNHSNKKTNFQPHLFKASLHTVTTAVAPSLWASLKNPFSGAHPSKYLQIKLTISAML